MGRGEPIVEQNRISTKTAVRMARLYHGEVQKPAMTDSIVITGASSGIGEACVHFLVDKGYNVFAGVRKQSDADRWQAAGVTPLIIDVTNSEQIRAAAEVVQKNLGASGLRAVVNNAGIAVGGPLEGLPLQQLRHQFDVNVFGLVEVIQTFMPLLRKFAPSKDNRNSKGPKTRIVNIGSIAGKVPQPFMGPYCASKHAVEALTDSMRYELAPWKIHSCVVEPGAVATAIWQKGEKHFANMTNILDEDCIQLYEPALGRLHKRVKYAAEHSVAPIEVAKSVYHAVSARWPKTRYVVGKDAKLGSRARQWLPDKTFDRLIMKLSGLSKL